MLRVRRKDPPYKEVLRQRRKVKLVILETGKL